MSEIQPAMIDIPIYKQTGSYAREHNELPQFRVSNLANIACRYAIDKSISDHFDGMHLNAPHETLPALVYKAPRLTARPATSILFSSFFLRTISGLIYIHEPVIRRLLKHRFS